MILAVAVALIIPLLTFFWILSFLYSGVNDNFVPPSPWRWLVGLLLPLKIASDGMRKKSLSQSGAVAGMVVGFLMGISCTRFLFALLTFFVFASKATKYKSSQKKKLEIDFKEGGQRNWVQVICNGGPAAILAILYMLEVGSVDVPVNFKSDYSSSWYAIGVLASIASASGDTFASEFGSVSGKSDPFHVLLWKKVPRGTNGGISVIGTLSSLFGGLIVGLAFYVATLLSVSSSQLSDVPPQWPIVFYATLAGGIGSLIDSLLGGSLQYSGVHSESGYVVELSGPDIKHISGKEWLDNHSVNLLSSILTGIIVPYVCAHSWPV